MDWGSSHRPPETVRCKTPALVVYYDSGSRFRRFSVSAARAEGCKSRFLDASSGTRLWRSLAPGTLQRARQNQMHDSTHLIVKHGHANMFKHTEWSSTDDHVVHQRNDHVEFTHSAVQFDSEQSSLQRVDEDYRDVLLWRAGPVRTNKVSPYSKLNIRIAKLKRVTWTQCCWLPSPHPCSSPPVIQTQESSL